MKLLTELQNQRVSYLVENSNGEKRHYIQGIFCQAEVKNKNSRIYPLPVLENEINRYTRENISRGAAYGEMGHPQGPNINLDRVAIHIKSLVKEGSNFVGKALIASTPMGDICKGLISDGANLGVSSRALGSLKPRGDGVNEVQSDLRLLAIDVVADPSAPAAYVRGIMENSNWIYDAATDSIVEEIVDTHKKEIKKKPVREILETQERMLEEFLNKHKRLF